MSNADDLGDGIDPARGHHSGRDRPQDRQDPLDYDARFADIVAQWNSDPTAAAGAVVAPYPVDSPGDSRRSDTDPAEGSPTSDATDLPDASDASDLSGAGHAGTDHAGADRPPQEGVPWRQHIVPTEPEEDFHPAPPAPLPRNDLGFWGATVGVVVGPLWLIFLVVTDPYGSRLPMGLAVALTLGGLALIVARLPRGSRLRDDDDDGAVV